MPGHVKKTDGPDPCPDQWLMVSDELKVKLKSKPYDPKKSVWVPDKATGGYDEGLIESIDGEKVTVKGVDSVYLIVCPPHLATPDPWPARSDRQLVSDWRWPDPGSILLSFVFLLHLV